MIWTILLSAAAGGVCAYAETAEDMRAKLAVRYSSPAAQIEVGGPYVGIESHDSSPLLNRISFFYPVANSIDLSDDYWRRGQSRIMFLGVKVGNGSGELLDFPFEYQQTPYMVSFEKRDSAKTISIAYEFCKNKPAMTAAFEITNNSGREETFEFYTHLEASLKTSQTSALKSSATAEFDPGGSAVYFNFADPETRKAQIFAANAGQAPSEFSAVAANSWIYRWDGKSKTPPRAASKRPAAVFVYKKKLAPGGKMKVVQIIGSAAAGEGKKTAGFLIGNYGKETARYERHVLDKAFGSLMKTGDDSLDASARWAKAVMAANAHYLDGHVVPMPCPAEYNFFFTHDALMTDLAAINFDTARVKKDLEFIASHAGPGGIIPHAYYWQDTRYVTEFAGKDNWNHFWFAIVSASYLRHSGDLKTMRRLYPLILAGIKQAAFNLKDDGLVWAYRPDWWDIGSSFGPRSYMTILAIRAWREFVFISSALGENTADLPVYAEQADKMQKQLNEKLWDEDAGYLINYYGDGKKDTHLYIGSLLAAHFGLLDGIRKNRLIETAGAKLVDGKVGVYNVFPMDFHLLGDYLKFKKDEAGGPYLYTNGGIWPHGNAWYALALMAAGRKDAALNFIKNVMTLDGIMTGPNGQPAMYEYRSGNKEDPSLYGKVDKPQFLWAGAWYLYSLYRLFGVRENEWNMAFEPYPVQGGEPVKYSLVAQGRPLIVTLGGSGKYIKSVKYGAALYPSAVIPEELPPAETIDISLGEVQTPYVADTSSALVWAAFDRDKSGLSLKLRAFPSHHNATRIISPLKPVSLSLNGKPLESGWTVNREDGVYIIDLSFTHNASEDRVIVNF